MPRRREQHARDEVREIAERKPSDCSGSRNSGSNSSARISRGRRRRRSGGRSLEGERKRNIEEVEVKAVASRRTFSLLVYETVADILKVPAVCCTVSVRWGVGT